MSIRGNLEEASLPDFLQLLSLGRKTGRISMTNKSNLGYIFIESGRIIHATLVNRPDRLGDLLARNEEITSEQLDEAIKTQGRARKKKLGEILIDLGAIDRPVLDRYVRRQTEESIYFLLTWQEGEILFEKDLAPRDEILVSIDPEVILMEGARRTDEWSVIEQQIPSLDSVFVLDRDLYEASDIRRTSDIKRIVALLDGTRNANQIIEETGLGSFEVGKSLYDLVTAGCVHPMRRESIESKAPPDKAAIDTDSPHFSLAQLEEYVAQKGEFSDPGRRKDAAHHIVDCRTCTALLGSTHQRMTTALRQVKVEASTKPAPATGTRPDTTNKKVTPDSKPQHLSDAEMLRYVQKEKEFADEEGRREAGRHIADCGECAKRVGKINRASRAAADPMNTVARVIQPKPKAVYTGILPRKEHLDEEELEQYSLRIGAFADTVHQKSAGGHIADCKACTDQLKRVIKKRKLKTAAKSKPAASAKPKTPKLKVPKPKAAKTKRASSGKLKETPADEKPVVKKPVAKPTAVKKAAVKSTAPRKSVVKKTVVEETVVEHYDYARLRSYAERSGNFADAEARRYARKHIMECAPCTEALRKVRRDIKDMAPKVVDLPEEDRRAQRERRAASEQRHARRRVRPDRRVENVPRRGERRAMLRRVQEDRRITDRRSISRRTAGEIPFRMAPGHETAAPAPIPIALEPVVALAEVVLAPAPTSPPRRKTTPTERPVPKDFAVAGSAKAAPPTAAAPNLPSPQELAEAPTSEALPAVPDPTAVPKVTDVTAGRPRSLIALYGGVPLRPDVSAKPSVPSSLLGSGPFESPEVPTAGQPRQPGTGPTARPTHPALPQRNWSRIAAAIAIVSLAGAAGWFGRALVSPNTLAEANAGAPPPVAAAPVTLIDSSTLAVEIVNDVVEEPSAPEPVVMSAMTPPPTDPPVREQPSPPARTPEPRAETPPVAVATPPVVEPEPEPTPPPVPLTTLAFGRVEDGGGAPLANVRLRLQDSDIETFTDADGGFVLADLPTGTGLIRAELEGYSVAQHEVTSQGGDSVRVDLVLSAVPRATEADGELGTGQWEVTDRAEVEFLLEVPLPLIEGLWTETIAKSTGRRPRVRIAQLTEDGIRIAIVISRPRPQAQVESPRVSALRVIPGTAAYPVTTGTASFGVLLLTAKSSLPAPRLQELLLKLQDTPGDSP